MDVVNEMEPSAMREVFVEVPDVKWSDIGGLETIKQELREAVDWLKYQGIFTYADAIPPKGILLYQIQPGTGKTLMAKATSK